MADKLLVATKSFITTDEDGKRVIVHAGKSRFRASHPIAQAFEGFFKDADDQPTVEDTTNRPSARSRRRTPADDAGQADAAGTSAGDAEPENK